MNHLAIAVAIIIVGTFGFLTAIIATLAQTLPQNNTDDTNRGRVFGSLQMIINFGAALPIFISGILTNTLSVSWSLLIIGLALLVYATTLSLRWRNYV
jgi:MFS family permease